MKEFIRFGELPKDGKSTIFKGNEPIGKESGVSVYEVYRNDNGYYVPVLPYPMTEHTLDDYVYHLNYFRGRVYLVHGDIVGYGSNNEPLVDIKTMIEIQNFKTI